MFSSKQLLKGLSHYLNSTFKALDNPANSNRKKMKDYITAKVTKPAGRWNKKWNLSQQSMNSTVFSITKHGYTGNYRQVIWKLCSRGWRDDSAVKSIYTLADNQSSAPSPHMVAHCR